MEPIELTFAVACTPAHAFDLWTRRASLWWPKGHSVTRDPQLEVQFEPRVGGRIVERTPDGDEHVWGEVTAWEPVRRLAYRWHLGQDAADATDVEITFEPSAGGGTDVRIVHGGWERLAERAVALRERNGAGWGAVLPLFRAAAEETATERSIP